MTFDPITLTLILVLSAAFGFLLSSFLETGSWLYHTWRWRRLARKYKQREPEPDVLEEALLCQIDEILSQEE